MPPRRPLVPDGHFYSPVVDIDEAERDFARIWPHDPEPSVGIDFNHEGQRRLILEEFTRLLLEYDYPDDPPADGRPAAFYNTNPQYGGLDSRSLFAMLRVLRPRRMVEVGCGYSSLLTADVSRRFLGEALELTCIEPYPPAFLRGGVPGITRLLERRVQEVSAAELALEAGDVLFIDSSHVAKLGSDVNHLYFEVLPRLAPGVVVHIHDIFLPYDYPWGWVEEGRSWNEQYLVRAMLTYSDAFRVLFAGRYAYRFFRDELAEALGGPPLDGCSLWLERTARAG